MSLDVDSAGNIYVLDNAHGVSVFDSGGELRARFGARGRGPAELSNARSIAIGSDTIFILDAQLKMFRTDGALLGAIPSDHLEFLRAHQISYTRQGVALFEYHFATRHGQKVFHDTLTVRFVNATTRERSALIHRAPDTQYLIAPGLVGPPLMGERTHMAATADGRILSTRSDHFHIEVRSHTGTLLEVIAADVHAVPFSRGEYNDYIAARRRNAPAQGPFNPEAPRAEFRPVLGRLVVSRGEAGHVLVERPDLGIRRYDHNDAKSRRVWQMFAPDWTAVGLIPLPTPFRPWAFDGCAITGSTMDSLDIPIVVRYKVNFGDSPVDAISRCSSRSSPASTGELHPTR